MIKITDDEYRLPEIYGTGFQHKFEMSANSPILISGIDKHTGLSDDYVVKLIKAQRMSSEASMRELLACFIAMQLEVPVVQPAIIDINDDFLELIRKEDFLDIAKLSVGFNFGAKYVGEYNTILLNKPLNEYELPIAQDIFAFDLLIQNTDRNKEKPNMLSNGHEIVVLDHEIAFSFVLTFGAKRIWEMQDGSKDWIRNHCLLPLIKRKRYDPKIITERLDSLNIDFWSKAYQLVPEQWRSDQFQSIKDQFTDVAENKGKFILELQKHLL
jgi:hypothetical protein